MGQNAAAISELEPLKLAAAERRGKLDWRSKSMKRYTKTDKQRGYRRSLQSPDSRRWRYQTSQCNRPSGGLGLVLGGSPCITMRF
jgi:hypothetical protein